MREYAKKPESQSRTLENNPKASRQAPIDVILQRYKERSIQQYTEDEELTQGKFDVTQREAIDYEELLQGKFKASSTNKQESVQREEKKADAMGDKSSDTIQRMVLVAAPDKDAVDDFIVLSNMKYAFDHDNGSKEIYDMEKNPPQIPGSAGSSTGPVGAEPSTGAGGAGSSTVPVGAEPFTGAGGAGSSTVPGGAEPEPEPVHIVGHGEPRSIEIYTGADIARVLLDASKGNGNAWGNITVYSCNAGTKLATGNSLIGDIQSNLAAAGFLGSVTGGKGLALTHKAIGKRVVKAGTDKSAYLGIEKQVGQDFNYIDKDGRWKGAERILAEDNSVLSQLGKDQISITDLTLIQKAILIEYLTTDFYKALIAKRDVAEVLHPKDEGFDTITPELLDK